jgi:CheY-like chemotaxis protein
MSIRVLLVDDQALFREGLRTLLSMHEDIEVVGEAGNGQEALDAAAALRPDVILMDLRMPVLDGVAATRRLKDSGHPARVIVLTTFDDDETVFDGLRAGAVGYLLKDVSSDKLVEAIRAAARGPAGRTRRARPAPARTGRTAVRPGTGDFAPGGRRRQQQGDRRGALHHRGHGQKPRHQHPRQAGRPRPDAGGADGTGVGSHLTQLAARGDIAVAGPDHGRNCERRDDFA